MMSWRPPSTAVFASPRCLPPLLMALLLGLSNTWHAPLQAENNETTGPNGWRAAMANSPFGKPLYVSTMERTDILNGDVYALFPHAFEALAAELRSAASLCEIVFLHINVKACVYHPGHDTDSSTVRMYLGRKHQLPHEDLDYLELDMHVTKMEADHLVMAFEAARGPYGTRDFKMHLQAKPTDEHESLVHLRYSFRLGLFTRFAMRIYFIFADRQRIGFSIEGYDSEGKPIYVSGLQGLIERNVMQLYLALPVHLETLTQPQAGRLDERLRRWHALTGQYPRQLDELDTQAYLRQKRLEHARQEALQANYPARTR